MAAGRRCGSTHSSLKMRRRLAMVALIAAANGCGDVDGVIEEELGEAPAEATSSSSRTQFVWPVAGWIAANTHYRNSSGVCDAAGAVHWTGSADLAVPFMSTVAAARGGTVIDVGFRDRSGYYVEIAHGGNVHSYYSHFAEPPPVSLGQAVTTGQKIGVSGQTGHASHAH